MKSAKFIFGILLLLVFSCKKDSQPQPAKPYDHRDYKVGTYRVQTDTGSYDIRIEKLDSLHANGESGYYLKIYNLLNLFPVTYYITSDINNKNWENSINVSSLNPSGVMIPHFDKEGNRWGVYSYSDVIDGVQYGRVSNDTLRLHVHISNIKYRIADQVPFVERYVKVEGVRVR